MANPSTDGVPTAASDDFEIDDPAILQVVYDPLRFRLLLLTTSPQTVTELAEAVGVPRGRLYYHVHRLEEHGLIEVAGERTVGTRVERSYRARYSSFRLAPSLRGHPLTQSTQPVVNTLREVVDKHLDAIDSSVPDRPSMFVSQQARLTPSRAEEFLRRLNELTTEFFGDDPRSTADDDDGSWYASLQLVTPLTEPFDDVGIRVQFDDET